MWKISILLAGCVALLISCGGTSLKTKGPDALPVVTAPIVQPNPMETRAKQVLDAAAFYYDRGETEYKNGHLEKARRDFDSCIDTFLLSGINPAQDKMLSAAFDTYITEIHKRELEAFQEGDGFTEVPLEPAPIDELDVPVEEPPVAAETNELIQKIEGEINPADYDIPVVVNSRVLAFISSFQHQRRYEMEGGLWRSGRYLDMVRAIFKEEGLPQDLAYVALIESSFKSHAYSRAHAMGMWQCLSGTGRRYNLRSDWWVDERCDPEKATHAAAGYFKDLYSMFGDWYLAMAAYNAGERTIENALKRTGKASFWDLADSRYLRTETKNYVPAILAGMLIAKNQEKYGFDIQPDSPIDFEVVNIPATTDLRLIAECADTTLADLQDLNPELRRLTTPKGTSNYALLLPRGQSETFAENFERIPGDKRVTWRLRTVQNGDTLTKIAGLYGTNVNTILQANSLQKEALAVGAKLIIPMGPKLLAQANSSPHGYRQQSTPTTVGGAYTVHSGDTIFSIARSFDISPSELMERNRLRSTVLHPGDKLSVHQSETKVASRGSYEKVIYLVKKGDTLYNIANNYNTTVDSIRSLNRLARSGSIRPGDRLTIYRGKK